MAQQLNVVQIGTLGSAWAGKSVEAGWSDKQASLVRMR